IAVRSPCSVSKVTAGLLSVILRAPYHFHGPPSARHLAPDDVAPMRPSLAPLLDHPLLLSGNEIEQWIAAHVDEPVRRQQPFDVFPRPTAEERELITDCRVLLAGPGAPRRSGRGAGGELPVPDDQASSRSEDSNPLVDRRLRMLECPEHMAADDEVEATGGERELLGVGLLEADRDAALGGLATRLGDHRRGEVDAGDVMPTSRQLEAEEAGAAAGVEHAEPASSGKNEIEDAIPRGALGGRADAVTEILVEVRRPPIPVGGDLSLDVRPTKRGHGIMIESFPPRRHACNLVCS